MTSGNFTFVQVADISIDRENRQRKKLEKVEELAESIRNVGLINPIVITRENVLVAGERRLEAHKLLGFDQIPVHYTDEVDKTQLHLIELEENVKRVDLNWLDQTLAIAEYHKLQTKLDPEWHVGKTAEGLGISRTHVSRHLEVSQAAEEGVPEVLEAERFSVAANFVDRRNERKKTSAKRDLLQDISTPAPIELEELPGEVISPEETSPTPATKRYCDILCRDFYQFADEVQETPYNLIHVDFPYGVSAGDTKGQSGARNLGGYEDGKEIYFSLLETFCNKLDNFCSPSAHLVFWFSMNYYTETVEALSSAGWLVNKHPLVWLRDNGILPDAKRGPRRIYETALLATRGDRKIVRAVPNGFSHQTPSTKDKIHMSEKPKAVLNHFFRMLVDETTLLLDPTCGSGNAISVAESLGASYSLGLEKNREYVDRAREALGLDPLQ